MTPDSASRVESVWGVLGTSITLAVAGVGFLVVLFGVMFLGQGLPLDVEAELAAIFQGGTPPFGLVPLEATKFPTQEVVVRLGLPAEGAGERGPLHPEEIVLVRFRDAQSAKSTFEGGGVSFGPPREEGAATREASAKLMAWKKEGDFAWHTTVRSDEIAWSRWTTRYRIERSFREDRTWRDSVRVDLTRPEHPLLLFAQYPPGVAAGEEAVALLVRQVALTAAK